VYESSTVMSVYWSCDENGRAGYGDTRWGAYLSKDKAWSAVCNHSDNRYEFYPECYFYEEYELDVCQPTDDAVKRQQLFESSNEGN
jgi:hypothetical protein